MNEELEKYYELQNKKNELLIAIYKIKAKIRKLKNKKNQYKDMRNFLIKVKENLLTLPKILFNHHMILIIIYII